MIGTGQYVQVTLTDRFHSACYSRFAVFPLVNSLWPRFHTIVISTSDIVQRPLKMPSRILQTTRILRRIEVGMDQLNQAVQILRRHSIVLLVEVVYVAVQDLDEKLNGNSSVHAGVSNAKGTLQALEHTLAVAVWLRYVSGAHSPVTYITLTSLLPSGRSLFSSAHHRWLARYTARH